MMFTSASASRQYVKAGKLRALAITSPRPSPLMPGLAVVAATLPGYETAQIAGLLAPAQTPRPVIERLNQEIVRLLERADTKERFAAQGVDTIGGPPEQFASMIRNEVARMGRLISDAGIREE